MAKVKRPQIRLRRPAVDVKKLTDGGYVLRSPYPPAAEAGSPLSAAVEGLWVWTDEVKLQALNRAENAEPVEEILKDRSGKITAAEPGTGKKIIDAAVAAIIKTKPHIYVDTADGLAALLPRLEKNEELRKAFLSRLGGIITVDGLIQPKHRKRLTKLIDDLPVIGLWGQQDGNGSATVQFGDPMSENNIGLPLPGGFLKLTPAKTGFNLSVTLPGNPDAAEPQAGDYRDAGVQVTFLDDMRPFKGLVLIAVD